MYSDKIDSKFFNVSIDGLSLIAEDLTPNSSFNRRETARHNIIGGTQRIVRTTYVHRDFSFTSHVRVDPLYPDVYDETFKLWHSKPVEVISKEMGGKFNAECIVKKTHETPSYLRLEIQLIEIPDETSLIPNDTISVPTDKVTQTNKKDNKKNTKKDTKKTTKKDSKKDKKNTKKTTKKSNKKTKKKKGSNITKVK